MAEIEATLNKETQELIIDGLTDEQIMALAKIGLKHILEQEVLKGSSE